MSVCNLCPRQCGVDRSVERGYCGESEKIRVGKAMLHFGEEPVITGKGGSGAIFFCGCNLRCVFCQNAPISTGKIGREITVERLCEIFYELEEKGAENINLVTATHFAPQIASALRLSKKRLNIPVVYNCGGYESVETLRMLEGLVDIYLPDFKYFSPELSKKYSGAPDYFEKATKALCEMLRQTGEAVIENGVMKRGVIVRHLVLPNAYKDSCEVMRAIARLPIKPLVSLMRQYTPEFLRGDFSELSRRLTTFEYEKVLFTCQELGLDGFSQEKSSATAEMTPVFDLEGI